MASKERQELIGQLARNISLGIYEDTSPNVIAMDAISTILAALQEDKALQEIIERYFNFPHGKGFGKARLAVFLNASPLGEQSE